MGLHVAMEEAQARLIGGEVESHFLGAAERSVSESGDAMR
jgi:hypothetical protein